MSKRVFLLVGLLVSAVVLMFATTFSTNKADASPTGCILDIQGTLGLVVCGGDVIDRLPLPKVTVSGPTITLPRPPAETVRVPGPTETIVQPGETVTEFVVETETATATETRTVTPAPVEETVTETASPELTGQPDNDNDIVVTEPEATDDPATFDLGDGEVTVVEGVIGTLGILALVALILLAMYGGYVMGYRDREKNEANFMRSVLDQAKMRRKH